MDEIKKNLRSPYVPFVKGGGDIRYYQNNVFIIWWTKGSIDKIKQHSHAFRNISMLGTEDLHSPLSSGKARGRFNIAQYGALRDAASMGICILNRNLNKFSLMAYLNSKLASFFSRILSKDRKWPAGILARIPVPIDFIIKKSESLKSLAKESFQLRRDWDTGYPMSPIFSESFIDKIIQNSNNLKMKIPNTGHPFCEEYKPCDSDTAKLINEITVKTGKTTIKSLINAVEQRFNLLIKRLDEIDNEINNVLYNLIDIDTSCALEDYYNTFVGNLGWKAEPDIWIKDFLMANLLNLIRKNSKGICLLKSFKESELGLYESFINLLSRKLNCDTHRIQPFLKELDIILGKSLERWIAEDFFFYHSQRFGGRPIIWQFSSRSKSNQTNAIDIYIDYHKINENTLPNIRVEYIVPLLKIYEQRKAIGTLPIEDVPKCDELEELIRAFIALEKGYERIPNPNALTGKNAQKGKGDDKTWEWVFSQAKLIIEKGYKPDYFKGVLVNIIPLCIELPEAKKKEFSIEYYSIFPKRTLKRILKKISALDQLKNSLISNNDDEKFDKKEIEYNENSNLDLKV